jgi:hypothetical protein
MDIAVTVFIAPRQQAGPPLFSAAKPALASVVDRPYIREMCNDYEQHVRWAEYCKFDAGSGALDHQGGTYRNELGCQGT